MEKRPVYVDSSAALGVAHRKVSGKLRHIEVILLWVQQASEEGRLDYNKIKGDYIPSGLLTEYLNRGKAQKLFEAMGQRTCEGRAGASL